MWRQPVSECHGDVHDIKCPRSTHDTLENSSRQTDRVGFRRSTLAIRDRATGFATGSAEMPIQVRGPLCSCGTVSWYITTQGNPGQHSMDAGQLPLKVAARVRIPLGLPGKRSGLEQCVLWVTLDPFVL